MLDRQVIGGLYGEFNIQDRLRKYAQDKKAFQFMALYERDSISLLRVISEKFGSISSDQITDFQVRYPEMDELPFEFSVMDTSGTTATVVVNIADERANALHTGHHLTIRNIFCNAAGSTTATIRSAANPLNETVRVMHVGSAGSGGTDRTQVTLRRLFPVDTPVATPIAITSAMTLVLSNNTAIEDGMPFPAVSLNSSHEFNYVQTTRESYGVSEHIMSGIETFLQEKPLDTAYTLTQTRMMKTVERAILTGRRAIKRGIGNKLEYSVGGVLEFIPSANIISFPRIIQPKNFTWLVKDIFDQSGVEEMWLFGGTNYATALSNAFANYSSFTSDELSSLKYNLKVQSFEAVGRPGVLKIVSAPILNQLGMANEAIVLNLTDKHKAFMMAEKQPFKDLPEDSDSLTPKGHYGKMREIYGMWTLIRRLAKTHFWIIDTQISY